jgi:hypothetical protein
MDYHNPQPGSFWLATAILDALHGHRFDGTTSVALAAKSQAATVARHERKPAPAEPTTRSRFRGVMLMRNRGGSCAWRAYVRRRGETWTGPHRPFTPEGELQAAHDYARHIGSPGPILRKGAT